MFESGLWIFFLESVLALGMLVFIVWWTLPKKRKEGGKQVTKPPPDQ